MKYGRLTIVKFNHIDARGKKYFECLCDCGRVYIARLDMLKSGICKSCGCLHGDMMKDVAFKRSRKFMFGDLLLTVPEMARLVGINKVTLWAKIRKFTWKRDDDEKTSS